MNYIDELTLFLGWCSIINVGVLIFSTVLLIIFTKPVKSIHSKMLNVPEENLSTLYFNYLGNYKVAIFIFNLAPYFALKLMA